MPSLLSTCTGPALELLNHIRLGTKNCILRHHADPTYAMKYFLVHKVFVRSALPACLLACPHYQANAKFMFSFCNQTPSCNPFVDHDQKLQPSEVLLCSRMYCQRVFHRNCNFSFKEFFFQTDFLRKVLQSVMTTWR